MQTTAKDFRVDPQAYEVVVQLGDDYSVLLAITYFLDQSRQHRGFEFYQRLTTFQSGSLPTGRQATFNEELLATDFAAHALDTSTLIAKEVIKQKMSETFGSTASVTVHAIQLRSAP